VQILSPLRIKVNTREEQILQTLLDKHCRAILSITKENAMTASKICSECNIPLSTVYRRLRLLQELKLLHVSCTIRNDGKKLLSFQNKIAEINILLYDNQLLIQTNFVQHE
jgi:DNA-binding transcriptional ArsR family regulator